MGQFKVLCLLAMCLVAVSHAKEQSMLDKALRGSSSADSTKTVHKRQLPIAAGLPLDFGDYYNLFLEYAAYDYYDWVCTENTCQLCDILTGECCDPRRNSNCFLPDSCSNNPCLSGGTCVNTRTVDHRADFTCVCQRGLTGKYCQLRDEFILPVALPIPVPAPAVPAPVAPVAPVAPAQPAYQAPAYQAPAYQAPAPQAPPAVQQPYYPQGGFSGRYGAVAAAPAPAPIAPAPVPSVAFAAPMSPVAAFGRLGGVPGIGGVPFPGGINGFGTAGRVFGTLGRK